MRKGLGFSSVLVALLLLFCAGCSDFEKNAHNTLLIAGKSYALSMKTCGKLYKEGKITEQQKQKIVDVGTIYYGAYNGAVDALLIYHDAKDKDTAKQKVSTAISSVVFKFNDFVDAYNDVVKGIEGINQEAKLKELKE